MSKITKNRLFELLSARHLNNPYSKLADIPSPDNFKDIHIATKRIKKAILEKETITGDELNELVFGKKEEIKIVSEESVEESKIDLNKTSILDK